jgi:hypothetical protein
MKTGSEVEVETGTVLQVWALCLSHLSSQPWKIFRLLDRSLFNAVFVRKLELENKDKINRIIPLP